MLNQCALEIIAPVFLNGSPLDSRVFKENFVGSTFDVLGLGDATDLGIYKLHTNKRFSVQLLKLYPNTLKQKFADLVRPKQGIVGKYQVGCLKPWVMGRTMCEQFDLRFTRRAVTKPQAILAFSSDLFIKLGFFIRTCLASRDIILRHRT